VFSLTLLKGRCLQGLRTAHSRRLAGGHGCWLGCPRCLLREQRPCHGGPSDGNAFVRLSMLHISKPIQGKGRMSEAIKFYRCVVWLTGVFQFVAYCTPPNLFLNSSDALVAYPDHEEALSLLGMALIRQVCTIFLCFLFFLCLSSLCESRFPFLAFRANQAHLKH
jgi:hypothetical protein